MNIWRISKYNPKMRDDSGAYLGEDWTSVSDMGKIFNGEELTLESYSCMENKYVSAASNFIQECEIESLLVTDLEKFEIEQQELPPNFPHLASDLPKIREGEWLSIQKAQYVFRLVLRELLWCKFKKDKMFFIYFGYDYYMYVGSDSPCHNSLSCVHDLGLFVENFPPSYDY